MEGLVDLILCRVDIRRFPVPEALGQYSIASYRSYAVRWDRGWRYAIAQAASVPIQACLGNPAQTHLSHGILAWVRWSENNHDMAKGMISEPAMMCLPSW